MLEIDAMPLHTMYAAAYFGTEIFSFAYGPNSVFFNLNLIGKFAEISTGLSFIKHASVYGLNFSMFSQDSFTRMLLLFIEPSSRKIL